VRSEPKKLVSLIDEAFSRESVLALLRSGKPLPALTLLDLKMSARGLFPERCSLIPI